MQQQVVWWSFMCSIFPMAIIIQCICLISVKVKKKMKCPNTCSKFWMSEQTLETLIWHHRCHCLKKDLHCCHRQIVKWTCSKFWTRLVIGLLKACWIKFPQMIFWNRFLIKFWRFIKIVSLQIVFLVQLMQNVTFMQIVSNCETYFLEKKNHQLVVCWSLKG